MRIECAFNLDSICFRTFHVTKMQYPLSNRIIMQSAQNQVVFQNDHALGYFNNACFWLSVIRLHYKHKVEKTRKISGKEKSRKKKKYTEST